MDRNQLHIGMNDNGGHFYYAHDHPKYPVKYYFLLVSRKLKYFKKKKLF